ncbi:nitronate monooxygenase family protein [Paracoccus sp. MC1862]|uniref:NAD(P)H-dependent flavin oxidoreductase n=1 Tax=Paracoccus sp. MC1862 TaxID=2760307 RepID=UPI0015FFDC48|nr:nitronate monooxygenase [Paracoccus sp. MC1862]MBB1498796.1 nitronate monooxygenase [Paracoccus sp. MC1862]QQO43798.1 nitronate monooxygenase [Paracoccus sp. MC1862]
MDIVAQLEMRVPVIQAPMAGVSTPALAAAVSNAGGLGSLGLAAMTGDEAAEAIARTHGLTSRPFGVNLFCHQPQPRDLAAEARWLARLAPHFQRFGATPPATLVPRYPSLLESDELLDSVLTGQPAVVTFHFGLPRPEQIAALRQRGCLLGATATSAREAGLIREAGLDMVVAQGWQAGGHRGIFDPDGPDERLDTLALVRRIAPLGLPVIAAGEIMDRADTLAALGAGVVAVQCGTAFLRAPEAATSQAHRAALDAGETVMTRAISGRPARCCANAFSAIPDAESPGYPATYAAGKALDAAARAQGTTNYGAHWAGTGCARAVARPAADTVAALAP